MEKTVKYIALFLIVFFLGSGHSRNSGLLAQDVRTDRTVKTDKNKGTRKTGTVRGTVIDSKSGKPVAGAWVAVINDTSLHRLSGPAGEFVIRDVPTGYNTLYAEADGYSGAVTESFLVRASSPATVEIELEERVEEIDAVVVRSSPFIPTIESPVSMRRIGTEEIDMTPGANRDISKVVQSAPGVLAVNVANRNDILVRGGGANENKYYLDGIEIPVLNHFAVQGGSGGNASLVNTDLLRTVNFYTGAFPAQFSSGLSSVLDMQMRPGNRERFHGKLIAGASDIGITLDTPLSRSGNTTFIGSYRRSYLQMLFNILELPFLPTYNDYQFKLSFRLTDKDELYVLALGSFDKNRLNTSLKEPEEDRKYILGYLPENDQTSYTAGIGYIHTFEKARLQITASRNYLNNKLYKYENNDKSLPRILDIGSRESDYRVRATILFTDLGGFRFQAGAGGGTGHYRNNTFRRIYQRTAAGNSFPRPDDSRSAYTHNRRETVFNTSSPIPGAARSAYVYNGSGEPATSGGTGNLAAARSQSRLNIGRYEMFVMLGKQLAGDKLSVSAALRAEGMSYSSLTSNPLRQLSPRLSLSYRISKKLMLSGSAARYYQEPSYTILGYNGNLIPGFRQKDGLRYMAVNHFVAGINFTPNIQSDFKIEGFYKQYSHLPVSLLDSLPVSTGDFADYIVGDVPVKSVGKGKAYGMEFSYRNLNLWNTVLNISYTVFNSKTGIPGKNLKISRYVSSGWNVRHILNISAIHKFGRNWSAGLKWYLTGGFPYTPYDFELSSLAAAWDARLRPYPDNSLYNTAKTPFYHQLDLRVDKVWYFNKWRLGFYLDIQNAYNFKAKGQDIYMPQTGPDGQYLPDPARPGHYLMQTVPHDLGGTILPTLGITLEL